MKSYFWRAHALWPMGLLLLAFVLIEALGLDRTIAHSLYYNDAEQRWIGSSGPADRWAHDVIHDGGRWLARAIGFCALLTWLLTFVWGRAQSWRRTAGFVFLAIALSVGTVGLLKVLTNVDCPWDLAEFGGKNPYVPLFGDRPDYLKRAECFPGAHASSGFALACFYFALRGRQRRRAWWALFAACFVGVVFSIGQEARGAHFLSHDLAAAGIVWIIQLGLYGWLLLPRDLLLEKEARQREAEHAGGEAADDVP